MLKIFLRKRFVCGTVRNYLWDDGGAIWYRLNIWKASFDDISDVISFFKKEEFEKVLFDRKTGIIIREGEDIENLNDYIWKKREEGY